jgi:hypothetical protein
VIFVSVGSRYWSLLREPLERETVPTKFLVATGGIGGRASQLSYWLRLQNCPVTVPTFERSPGEAALLGKTVRLTWHEVLQKTRQGLISDPLGASRFETWCVAVDREPGLESKSSDARMFEFLSRMLQRLFRKGRPQMSEARPELPAPLLWLSIRLEVLASRVGAGIQIVQTKVSRLDGLLAWS